MPPKQTSKNAPSGGAAGKGAAPTKPGIIPPTKAQIKGGQKAADGASILQAGNLNKLLGRQQQNEFAGEAPVDLRAMQRPEEQRVAPSFQPQQNQNFQYQQPEMYAPQYQNPPQQQQQYYQPPPPQSYQQPENQNPFQAHQQQPINPPGPSGRGIHARSDEEIQSLMPPRTKQKKPSEMTKAEYEQYQKVQMVNGWKNLIEINIFRQPSTMEKEEFAGLEKNPQFAQLVQEAMRRKEAQNPRAFSAPGYQQQAPPQQQQPAVPVEAIRPTPKPYDTGSFNPSQEPSQQLQYQRPFQPLQPLHQPPPQDQYGPPGSYIVKTAAELQTELNVQREIQIRSETKISALDREVASLTSELHRERSLRIEAELQVKQFAQKLDQLQQQIQVYAAREGDLDRQREELKSQQAQFSQQLQYQFNQQQMQQNSYAMQPQQVVVQSATPVNLLRPGRADIRPEVQIENQSPFPVQQTKPVQIPTAAPAQLTTVQVQQPITTRSEPVDPNLNTAAANDIDQIMKNANIILNQYSGFDETFKSPDGQQMKKMYKNYLHKTQGQDDLVSLLQQNEQDNSDDVTKPPNEVPASLLNDVQPLEEEESERSSVVKALQEEEEQGNVEKLGSLLPKSKYNSRAGNLRK